MRKITEEIVLAFYRRETKKIGNSLTTHTDDGVQLLSLHYNVIAKIENNELWITDAGWSSMTTKERLNGLHGVSIVQRRGTWYLNGNEWDGSWIKVS